MIIYLYIFIYNIFVLTQEITFTHFFFSRSLSLIALNTINFFIIYFLILFNFFFFVLFIISTFLPFFLLFLPRKKCFFVYFSLILPFFFINYMFYNYYYWQTIEWNCFYNNWMENELFFFCSLYNETNFIILLSFPQFFLRSEFYFLNKIRFMGGCFYFFFLQFFFYFFCQQKRITSQEILFLHRIFFSFLN